MTSEELNRNYDRHVDDDIKAVAEDEGQDIGGRVEGLSSMERAADKRLEEGAESLPRRLTRKILGKPAKRAIDLGPEYANVDGSKAQEIADSIEKERLAARDAIANGGERKKPVATPPAPAPAPAKPSLENGDTVVNGGKGETMFGKYKRVVDQKTRATKFINTETGKEETPQSAQMQALMNKGVTSLSLSNSGKTWEQAIADVQNANSDAEAKRLANQAKFMQMKRDERVKRNAEMHKEAYGVAKYAYDQLLGGGGEVRTSKDGKKYRVVKITGNMLEQTNANRLSMGNGDKIGTVFATIPVGEDGKTPYGEARFDFVVEQGGNVKAGGQKTWRTMTLDQIRGNYGKALGNSGGNAKDADAAFGSWKDRVAANAQKDWAAANPDGGKMQQIQAASDAAIKLENVKAQNALNLFMKQAENERTMLEAKLKQSGAENSANIASREKIEANRLRAENIRSAQSMVQGMITALIKDGVEVTDKTVAQAVAVARQTLGLEDYGGASQGAQRVTSGNFGEIIKGGQKVWRNVDGSIVVNGGENPGNGYSLVTDASQLAAKPTPEQQKAAQDEIAKRKAVEAQKTQPAAKSAATAKTSTSSETATATSATPTETAAAPKGGERPKASEVLRQKREAMKPYDLYGKDVIDRFRAIPKYKDARDTDIVSGKFDRQLEQIGKGLHGENWSSKNFQMRRTQSDIEANERRAESAAEQKRMREEGLAKLSAKDEDIVVRAKEVYDAAFKEAEDYALEHHGEGVIFKDDYKTTLAKAFARKVKEINEKNNWVVDNDFISGERDKFAGYHFPSMIEKIYGKGMGKYMPGATTKNPRLSTHSRILGVDDVK